jgi:hypothetical protein
MVRSCKATMLTKFGILLLLAGYVLGQCVHRSRLRSWAAWLGISCADGLGPVIVKWAKRFS